MEYNEIYLLGDSLSAGIGHKDVITWPTRVNKTNRLKIIDLSKGGSRVKDGLKMVPKIENKNRPILIALGGNDWRFGKFNNIKDYQNGLERLLSSLCIGRRTVIMFEIPFPPLEYQLLKSQRDLIRKYNVKMIPKRFLSDVLFIDPNATVDGLHLSNIGHERFAEKLISILS
ncbi:SGNH/GDSL hydrolase family protein [candidate division CSSED10-310 bacterium]|uniref:SGNH/GDSL hydrolase family protein n=1 Tax=candidate division CSSED10-310 bacterium TaxID=2855610 RepID=A0ABV6YUC9_UNCC1